MSRLLVCACIVGAFVAAVPVDAAPDEFVGPFPSWRDLRRDYGAVGDGVADDTAALQRGVQDLVEHEAACVLYIPSGVYRLTSTVSARKGGHNGLNGVAVIGEDPSSTVLRWDGPQGGQMFGWDAWWSKVSRLTFDGAGRARLGLGYGETFTTGNETSDVVFQDLEYGIGLGSPEGQGQAENVVLRCTFIRCGTGIFTCNWNSMDIWVWYCRFIDCGRGIDNFMGCWHAWHNLFMRSRVCDMCSENLGVFTVVGNTSVASRCFLDFRDQHAWGSAASLTGNCVLDPTGDAAVALGNAGPYLVADNVFRTSGGTRALLMTWGAQVLIGNTYSAPEAVEENGRFLRIDEKVVDGAAIPDHLSDLPTTPGHQDRPIIEVPSGAHAETIQRAIDAAAAISGRRPVVHLPMGAYTLDRGLVVPSGSDLQLVGDGIAGASASGTRLLYAGPAGGSALRLDGPTQATLRDLCVIAGHGQGITVTNADQPGGWIYCDQLFPVGPADQSEGRTAAVRISKLADTRVLFRALQGGGNGGAWVSVVGPSASGGPKQTVLVLTGATAMTRGYYDIVDGGELVLRGVYHEVQGSEKRAVYLDGRGVLAMDGSRINCATSETEPTVSTHDFQGLLTIATSAFAPQETDETCRLELAGDGSSAQVLALGDVFWVVKPGASAQTVWRNLAEPPAAGGIAWCTLQSGNEETMPGLGQFLDDPGQRGAGVGDEVIRRHLGPLRTAEAWLPPAGDGPRDATALFISRVWVEAGRNSAVQLLAFRSNLLQGTPGYTEE